MVGWYYEMDRRLMWDAYLSQNFWDRISSQHLLLDGILLESGKQPELADPRPLLTSSKGVLAFGPVPNLRHLPRVVKWLEVSDEGQRWGCVLSAERASGE
jgi:hypothetical protein